MNKVYVVCIDGCENDYSYGYKSILGIFSAIETAARFRDTKAKESICAHFDRIQECLFSESKIEIKHNSDGDITIRSTTPGEIVTTDLYIEEWEVEK